MKPAPFMYTAPTTVEEACALLAEHGDEAKVLAGGQSLGPMMNLRLAAPEVIVDINHVERLGAIGRRDGALAIGALARQRAVERSELVAEIAPMIPMALRWVGHVGVRNSGTVAGSIAHADPAGEMPAVLLALDGAVLARSVRGDRLIPADELFSTYFTTTLEPDELLVKVLLPPRPSSTGHAWQEFAQRHGDYAMAGVGVRVTLDADGVCADVRVVLIGVDGVPHVAATAARALIGREPRGEVLREAAELAAAGCDPPSDILADGALRRRIVRRLVPTTIESAVAVAKEVPHQH